MKLLPISQGVYTPPVILFLTPRGVVDDINFQYHKEFTAPPPDIVLNIQKREDITPNIVGGVQPHCDFLL